MAYTYTNKKGTKYYLHSRQVKLRGSGKLQTIFFFAREIKDGALEDIPGPYEVVENQKTGLPILRKK